MTPRALSCIPAGAILALSACTGANLAAMMPGTRVTEDGFAFTVTDTPRGLTVRNFETGFSDPARLQAAAARAAERVSGCPVTTITKETGVNTYRAAVACPI